MKISVMWIMDVEKNMLSEVRHEGEVRRRRTGIK